MVARLYMMVENCIPTGKSYTYSQGYLYKLKSLYINNEYYLLCDVSKYHESDSLYIYKYGIYLCRSHCNATYLSTNFISDTRCLLQQGGKHCNSIVFTRLLPPCTQPCTEQGVNKVEISIWVG